MAGGKAEALAAASSPLPVPVLPACGIMLSAGLGAVSPGGEAPRLEVWGAALPALRWAAFWSAVSL